MVKKLMMEICPVNPIPAFIVCNFLFFVIIFLPAIAAFN
jgi:hypothetical protein